MKKLLYGLLATTLLAGSSWGQNATTTGGGVTNGSSPSFGGLTVSGSAAITTLVVGASITAGTITTPSIQLLTGNINYSGSQGTGANQYGIYINSNLTGAISSGSINANEIVINSDTVNMSADTSGGIATNWLGIYGNVGTTVWTPTTVYAAGTKRNNGGRIYVVATGGGGTSGSSGGPTGTGTGITDGTVTWNYVSPDFSGSRAALQIASGIVSPEDPAAPHSLGHQWPAEQLTMSISANQGGTANTGGNTQGTIYSGGDQAWCFSGATFLTACVGREIDVGVFTGASTIQRTGLSLVSYGNNTGAYADYALGVGAIGGAPGFKIDFALLGGAVYPVTSTGAIFQYLNQYPGNLAGGGLTYVNPVSSLGFDLAGLEAGIPWRSTGGTQINEDGSIQVQSLKISTSGSTVSIDPVGSELSTLTISGSGAGMKTTDDLYDPVTGFVVNAGTVNGSGNITALGSIVEKGHYVGSAPSNPITMKGGTGTTATANATWTAAATLALAPSGAEVVVGSGSALATGATAGFFHLPFTSATPTGTPGNTTPGCEWNQSTRTLNCYDGSSGGGWFHVTFSSGAG